MEHTKYNQEPRIIVIPRSDNGFGFTIRHFLVYPPDCPMKSNMTDIDMEPMGTIFVKCINKNSCAEKAGLSKGDRIIRVNDLDITNKTYPEVIRLIQNSRPVLKLAVLPMEKDILQKYFSSSAHNPETNTRPHEYSAFAHLASNTRNAYIPRLDPNEINFKNVFVSPPYPSFQGSNVQQGPYAYPRLTSSPTTTPLSSSSVSNFVPSAKLEKDDNVAEEFNRRSRSCKVLSTVAVPQPYVSPDIDSLREKSFSILNSSFERLSNVDENNIYQDKGNVVAFRLVSQRTKEFETGKIDKKITYPSNELLRVSTRNYHPKVSSRKQEYEENFQKENNATERKDTPLKNITCAVTNIPEIVQIRSFNTDILKLDKMNTGIVKHTVFYIKIFAVAESDKDNPEIPAHISKNQTIIVGSSRIHCDPPQSVSEYADVKEKTLKQPVRKSSYLAAIRSANMDANSMISCQETVLTENEPLHSNSMSKNFIIEEFSKYGYLFTKTVIVEGKRAQDRSWKMFGIGLRGHYLYFLYETKNGGFISDDFPINIKNCIVETANDYKKKKHVLRLITENGSQYLLQTEDNSEMFAWIRAIRKHSIFNKISENVTTDENFPVELSHNLLPFQTENREMCKNFFTHHQYPSQISHIYKSRRSIHQVKPWKHKMSRPRFRLSLPSHDPYEQKTFGIPLEHCLPSSKSQMVPFVVDMCCSLIEKKGMNTIGIYRIPGNKTAETSLIDALNKSDKNFDIKLDPRWTDVHVISSLLKYFFRNLPQPLITTSLYPHFMKASKMDNNEEKLTIIYKLLQDLPDYHFETLKYLIKHLRKVADKKEINKMNSKNLAIVFGPTLVRADSSETLISNVKGHCELVELLINYAHWLFDTSNAVDKCRTERITDIFKNQKQFSVDSKVDPVLEMNNSLIKPQHFNKNVASVIINAAHRKSMRFAEIVQKNFSAGNVRFDKCHHETENHSESSQELGYCRNGRKSFKLDKLSIEQKLQDAKKEMENEDILDALADNPIDVIKKINEMTELSKLSAKKNINTPIYVSSITPISLKYMCISPDDFMHSIKTDEDLQKPYSDKFYEDTKEFNFGKKIYGSSNESTITGINNKENNVDFQNSQAKKFYNTHLPCDITHPITCDLNVSNTVTNNTLCMQNFHVNNNEINIDQTVEFLLSNKKLDITQKSKIPVFINKIHPPNVTKKCQNECAENVKITRILKNTSKQNSVLR